MAYATADDIIAIYGEETLTNVATPPRSDTVDEARVQRALDQASSEVDAYLSGRYTVPLPVERVTPFLKQVVVNLAVYAMALSLSAQTDEMRRRYEDAIKFLSAAASGKGGIGIGNEDDDAASPGPDSRVVRTAFLMRA
ncbi:gp436 family protein [Methylobacterium hispanicum]|uniref:gp436 family protein n=1 Tax=Methylobacterium hispanicum TaxID=270350 RepID=UPI002F2DC41C